MQNSSEELLKLSNEYIKGQYSISIYKGEGQQSDEKVEEKSVSYLQQIKMVEEARGKIMSMQRIKKLTTTLFERINADIRAMESNHQQWRLTLTQRLKKVKQSITTVDKLLSQLSTACKAVHNKTQLLECLRYQYSSIIKQLKPILHNWDTLLPTEEENGFTLQQHINHYDNHFQPVVELLLRSKNMLMNQYRKVADLDGMELAEQGPEFLQRVKVMLEELNRHAHGEGSLYRILMQHIHAFRSLMYQQIRQCKHRALINLNTINQELCKGIYLSWIMEDEIQRLNQNLRRTTQTIVDKMIQDQSQSALEDELDLVKTKLEGIERRISVGKAKLMVSFLNRKICKRRILVEEVMNKIYQLAWLIHNSQRYLELFRRMRTIKASWKNLREELKTMNHVLETNPGSFQPSLFEKLFINTQQFTPKIFELQAEFMCAIEGTSQSTMGAIMNSKVKELENIKIEVVSEESKLSANYNSLEQRIENMSASAILSMEGILEEGMMFVRQQVNMVGFSLKKEDKVMVKAKKILAEIEKTEEAVSLSQSSDMSELIQLKKNIQWLIQVLDKHFSPSFLQNMVGQLNFEHQDWKSKVKVFNHSLSQLEAYVRKMSQLSSSKNISQLLSPIHRLIRARTQLYEIIVDILMEVLYVFEESKKLQQFHPDLKGLVLMNEDSLAYIFMIYQFKKKLREESAELQNLDIPKSLRQYLSEKLFQTFIDNFQSYLPYTEQQLLELGGRLENAVSFFENHENIFDEFERIIKKSHSQDGKIAQICRQILLIEEENIATLNLQDSKYKIKKISVFSDLHYRYQPYYKQAKDLLRRLQNNYSAKSSRFSQSIRT